MAADAGVKSLDDLRGFSVYLRNLSSNMLQAFTHARLEMYRVNEGWNDTENEKFMQEFEQRIIQINNIADHMDQYSNFIEKKCDVLEQYMNIRL